MYIVHTCHTILLLLKQDHHTCNDTSSKTSQTIIMPCQIKKTKPYLRTAHSTVGHICCLGRWAPPGSLLGSPVPPPMPLQHPQQCLICRRTQIEMDAQAQKIARNGHWSVKMSTSTNAPKFHSLLAPSHIFHELWMSFLKHKVSVFGVDLDRKEKAEGQRGASDLLCHFCSYTFHHLVIVFVLYFSACVFTSACQLVQIQIQRRGGPSSLLQFCISSAATLFQEWPGNLNIPFEYFHRQLEYSQVYFLQMANSNILYYSPLDIANVILNTTWI